MAHTHPLLEMMFPRRSGVGDQLASLTTDVARLANQVRRYSAPRIREAAHEAGDFAGDFVEHMRPIARDIAHRARDAGKVVREDPVPAVVAIGTFALIATLLLRRQ